MAANLQEWVHRRSFVQPEFTARTSVRNSILSFRSAVHSRIPYKSDLHRLISSSDKWKSLQDTLTQARVKPLLCQGKGDIFLTDFSQPRCFGNLGNSLNYDCMPVPWPEPRGASLSTLTDCVSTDISVTLWKFLTFFWGLFSECWAVHRPTTWSNRLVFWIFCSFGI